MTRTTVNGKDILVIEVPESWPKNFWVENGVLFNEDTWSKKHSPITLPLGQWEIVLDDHDLKWGQLGDLVADKSGYYTNFELDGLIYQAPMDSYRSLLRSLDLPTDKRYIVLQNNKS